MNDPTFMTSPSDRERRLAHLREATARMAQHNEELDPLSYAVWYDYAAGGSTELRHHLDEAIATGRLLPPAVVRDLFVRYVAGPEILSIYQAEIAQLRDELDQARHEATVDGLTNLPNRRAFDAQLRSCVDGLGRCGDAGSTLMLLDIDHFKAINDLHGHSFGDQVLCTVGAVLRSLDGLACAAARIGGDEFALILPSPSEPQARRLGEQLRARMAGCRFPSVDTQDASGIVTVSIGATALQPDDTPLSWLRRADRGLYVAKRSGRNQVSWVATEAHASASSGHWNRI